MFVAFVLDYCSISLCSVTVSMSMVLMYVSSDCEDDCNLMSQTSDDLRLLGHLLILILYVYNDCGIVSV